MKSYPNRPRTQSEAWLGPWPVLLRTLVTVLPSYTSRISRQPNPQWGQAVSTRSVCQGRLFTGLRFSVRAPTGQRERHSPQEMQSSRSLGVIRPANPFPARSMATRPDTSRQAR